MGPVIGIGVIDLPLITFGLHIRPVERRRVVEEVVSVQIALRGVGIGPDICFQIFVRILDGLIEHRHDNIATACILLPRVEQVDIGARLGDKHLITGIVVMPLRREQRVVHRHRRTSRRSSGAPQRTGREVVFQPRPPRIFEHLDPTVVTQLADHLPQGKRLVKGDLIPLMQTERAVTLLEPRIGTEQRTDSVDPHGRKQLVGRGESRAGHAIRGKRSSQRIGCRRFEFNDQLALYGSFGIVNDLHAGGRTAVHGKRVLRVVCTCRHRQNPQQQQNFSHHKHLLL